jgi:membrane protein
MAIRKLRIEKLLSDELKNETDHFVSDNSEPNFEADEEHTRKFIEK